MYEYYFKIKKGDIEFECSTTDKITFEEKLSDWINGVVKGEYVAPPENNTASIQEESPVSDKEQTEQEKPQRSGFIDVKNLMSINEITTPQFNSSLLPDEKNNDMPEADFEQTLADSMQNPKTEVVEKKDTLSDFEGYLASYKPQNDTDRLIVAAKYILNIENQERFSIKQINAKLVPATGKPVDHSMIEEAIMQNLVRIVPDLTGTSEFTEYTLTEDGEGYFVD